MNIKIISGAVVAAIALGAGMYQLGAHQSTPGKPAPAARTPLYWHDPMVPGQRFDRPGKSPFMDMQLVPVYAGEGGDEGKVAISPRMQQNLGVRTALVARGQLAAGLTAVGSVAYNERDQVLVQARANGFVEKLYVRATLDHVRKGQPLLELYVPDWIAAQEEFLTARRLQSAGMAGVAGSARQRMLLAGMSEEQVRLVESSGLVHPRVTVTAPGSGVVAELAVREGMTVAPGALLFRLNGVGSVWVNADVPESQAAQLRPGMSVEVHAPGLPGAVFKGKLGAILPEVNTTTRTLKARVEVDNPSGQLVPGMFASLRFSGGPGKEVLTVPTEAVIQTGTRSVVMVAEGDGRFHAADVEAGIEANGQTEIRSGLEAGQRVVVSGQFLVDSDASLKGTASRLGQPPGKAQ